MQVRTDRAHIDAAIHRLDTSFEQARTVWATEATLQTWNRDLAALSTTIAARNCITAKQVERLQKLVQHAATTDHLVEGYHWRHAADLGAYMLTPFRALNLYRATAKIDTMLLEKELIRQQKRLATEARFVLAGNHSLFVRGTCLEVEKRMRDAVAHDKTIVSVIPGTKDELYEVLLMVPGTAKINHLSIRIGDLFF